MLARILFITDLHKRYSDMRSIKNILPVQHQIQNDIIEFNRKAGITHCVICGDWYDRGFHDIGQAYSSMEEDRLLSKSVNGNVYLCLGNHFFLERDANPEMYIIQPCEYVRPRNLQQLAEEPIFKVVPKLRIGPVQISFFHFNKVNKNYVTNRDDDVTFHVGVYHDDRCVPYWVREREGFGGSAATSGELLSFYNNIDLAIHGHIHSKIGLTKVPMADGRQVPLWIPGALGMTQDKEAIKHTDVDLPVIEIADDGTVQVMSAKFKTHIDKLQFYKTAQKVDKSQTIQSITDPKKLKSTAPSLKVYLRNRGYDDRHIAIIDEAGAGSLTLQSAVSLLAQRGEPNG